MRYSFSRLRPVLAAAAAVMMVIAGASSALAQTNYGAVRGEVKDTTGAHIKDATVVLTNVDTKVERTTHTTAAGDYLFSAVDPGNYSVVVTDTGFKQFETAQVRVELGATSTIDAALQVGASGEIVEVSAATPLLDTASASGGQLFSEQQLTDLPNLGRNPFVFDKLDNNVTPVGDPRFVRAEDQSGTSSVSVAGAPIGANNYIVDGIPISTSSGGVTFIPSLEAVSDAKVQANTYDAEVGRTGGGAFNTSLKSGTAQYHGVLYGETRQTNWAANVWFNPTNKPTADDTTYLYAGAFGGPVPFMKKFKYLDKTFFWVTEEGYRQAQPYTSATTSYYVPTAAERAGDFSGDGVTLYDPNHPFVAGKRTCLLYSNGDCATGRANVLPASYINPIGKSILNAFPAPTQGGNFTAGPNYYNVDIFKTRSDMYSGKVEHTFAPWYTATASYVHLATQEPNGNILHVTAENDGVIHRFNDATAVNNTFTVTPTTLLTVGFGFNRYYSNTLQYSTGFNAANGFDGAGFTSGFANQLQSKSYPTISFTGVTNSSGLGAVNAGPTINYSRNVVVGINKTVGRHNVKFGYVWRSIDVFTQPATGGNGSFTFNGQYSNNTGAAASGSVAAFADLLMGLPSAASATITSNTFNQVEHYHALYAQDDFRLNSKLTMNLGLRYEYEQGQSESNNRYNVGFSPTVTSTYAGTNGTVAVKGGLLFAGVNGAPVHCCNEQHAKFSPRIGVAFQPMTNTVFHVGFGVFYAPVALSNATAGYSQASSYSPGNASGQVTPGPSAYLSSPFNNGAGLLQPSGNSLGALTGIGGTLSNLQDFGRRYPYVQQYSMDVQQQLPYGTMLKIGYVGAHAANFNNTVNLNQLSDAVLSGYVGTSTNLATTQKNPYAANTIGGYPATGVVASANVGLGQLLLPFPQFSSISVQQSNGYSHYNSLAIKAQKRMTHGLTVLGTYTWSSNWDNLYSASSSLNSNQGPQDNTNPNAEYARAINNLPNRFTAAVTYELPFGRGKFFFGNANRLVDEFIGGWKINDEWVAQNGGPLAVVQTNLNTQYGVTGVGGSSQRPNIVGDIHAACGSGRPQSRLGRSNGLVGTPYINAAAFSVAQPYTYGNAPRTLPCQGPGYDNSDISVNKAFAIGEKLKVEFRAEALNAFNTPQFGTPATTLVVNTASTTGASPAGGNAAFAAGSTNQTLGNVTSQLGFPRILQMGGRITF